MVRHCEASGNKNRIFHGHFDSDITENGKSQLKLLSERFKKITFDAIYSSDLKRAYKTAEAVNKYMSHNITEQRELREIYGGEWENIDFEEIAKRFPVEFEMWTKSPENFRMPGGESYLEFYGRIKTAIYNIISQNKGKTVVAVTHGTAIKLYLTYASGLDLSRSEEIAWCDNTAVSAIDYDENSKPHIVYMNDSNHLTTDTETITSQKWWQEYINGGKRQ